MGGDKPGEDKVRISSAAVSRLYLSIAAISPCFYSLYRGCISVSAVSLSHLADARAGSLGQDRLRLEQRRRDVVVYVTSVYRFPGPGIRRETPRPTRVKLTELLQGTSITRRGQPKRLF